MNIANPHTKKYYLSHREEIAGTQKNYQMRNLDAFNANSKKYYDKNKNTLIQCPCVSEISFMGKRSHLKTKKHLAFQAENPPLSIAEIAP
jgi:hypothetical protein